MTEEVWGEWVLHDGKGCPCKGMWVHRIADGPGLNGGRMVDELEGIVVAEGPWIWGTPGCVRIIRYRIRRPRALLNLIEMVENLPAPVAPEVVP